VSEALYAISVSAPKSFGVVSASLADFSVFGNPLDNSTAQLLNFSSESSSALDQVNDYDDDSNYEEEMD
jgi:hypothetical protein